VILSYIKEAAMFNLFKQVTNKSYYLNFLSRRLIHFHSSVTFFSNTNKVIKVSEEPPEASFEKVKESLRKIKIEELVKKEFDADNPGECFKKALKDAEKDRKNYSPYSG